jgi:FkbM family methyltransferase
MNAQARDRNSARQSLTRRARQAATAPVVRLLARRTPYLESEMLGLAGLVPPGAVCVDVGAAAGLYSVLMARLAGPDGQVLSIEPVGFAHPFWSRLLGVRSMPNVRRYRLALGSQPGGGVMSVPLGRHGPVTGRSYLDWKCSGSGSNTEFARRIEVGVDVQTLDGLCASAGLTRLDFVKIDVEGGEMHVLEGARRAIDTFRPALLVEIEDRHAARYQNSADDVAAWLLRRGYTMHAWNGGWEPVAAVCTHTRNYLFRPGAEGPGARRAAALAPGRPAPAMARASLESPANAAR